MAESGGTVWAPGFWADDFWAAGFWADGDAPPPDPKPAVTPAGRRRYFIEVDHRRIEVSSEGDARRFLAQKEAAEAERAAELAETQRRRTARSLGAAPKRAEAQVSRPVAPYDSSPLRHGFGDAYARASERARQSLSRAEQERAARRQRAEAKLEWLL